MVSKLFLRQNFPYFRDRQVILNRFSEEIPRKLQTGMQKYKHTSKHTGHVASSSGHSQILSRSRGVQDKIWEWPGDEATGHA